MKLLIFLSSAMVILTTAETIPSSESYNLPNKFLTGINQKRLPPSVGKNPTENVSMGFIQRLLDLHINSNKTKPSKFKRSLHSSDIPESFDWRNYYPNCSTIRDIRDQGSCGSCWAFAVVEVISDRICIHSKGKLNVYVSANDLFSCCDTCCGDDCDYGYPVDALNYWVENGIVSGGPYGSNQGCSPYEIPPCEHFFVNGTRPSCESLTDPRPNCTKTCRSDYHASYLDDLNFGKVAYKLPPHDVEEIQIDIMTHGPVTATFSVYDDFLEYKNGVYIYTEGNYTFDHVVKILGWGVEDDEPYWLAANSWNTDWGDNGFFKFLRGENHCDIEENICGGIPG